MNLVELLGTLYNDGHCELKGMNDMLKTIAEQLRISASSPSHRKALGMDTNWEKSIASQVVITKLLSAQHPKTMEELATR